jgi:DNA-binding SARP family transcriptional activator
MHAWEMERKRVYLRTFGHPALLRADGSVVVGLRRKDLALLAYLCIERGRAHPRERLATLLWGESPEKLARHSLTQALGRILRAAGRDALALEKDTVRWTGVVGCDAAVLLRDEPPRDGVLESAGFRPHHFLEAFDPGSGAEDFYEWAERTRVELAGFAVHLLEQRGAQAEDRDDWEWALRLGERAVAIDPFWEQGHRRVMRAYAALGERARALRHYQAFAEWLADEMDGEPASETQALAAEVRAAVKTGAASGQVGQPASVNDASAAASRAPSGRLRVFLCHSSSDKPFVRALYEKLGADGFEPWLDEEDLLPGQEWEAEIARAVRASDVVLVCLSRGAVERTGFVQREIRMALDAADEKPGGTIFLVPLRIEECPVPERISRWHYVDYFLPKGHERLVRALRERAKQCGRTV